MSSKKRKYREKRKTFQSACGDASRDGEALDPNLYILAFEADVVRGARARHAAQSLEQPSREGTQSALIQWTSLDSLSRPTAHVDDDFAAGHAPERGRPLIWADRYDALFLLDTLPNKGVSAEEIPRSLSPSGWSDLPSDTEDTFFFSPEKKADYQREKQQVLINRVRDERVRAREREDEESARASLEEDPWGGDGEEPDENQIVLMERTAGSLASSDNVAQLEMRILANHGTDGRFAFLRGRWKNAWSLIKLKARMRCDDGARKGMDSETAGLGALANYGDSDESDTESGSEDPAVARKGRAKAWAESRYASHLESIS